MWSDCVVTWHGRGAQSADVLGDEREDEDERDDGDDAGDEDERLPVVPLARGAAHRRPTADGGVASDGVDFKVPRHRTVPVSNSQSIEVSSDDWIV